MQCPPIHEAISRQGPAQTEFRADPPIPRLADSARTTQTQANGTTIHTTTDLWNPFADPCQFPCTADFFPDGKSRRVSVTPHRSRPEDSPAHDWPAASSLDPNSSAHYRRQFGPNIQSRSRRTNSATSGIGLTRKNPPRQVLSERYHQNDPSQSERLAERFRPIAPMLLIHLPTRTDDIKPREHRRQYREVASARNLLSSSA